MPSIHTIQKHQGSQGLRKATWFVGGLSLLLFVAITGWLCYLVYNFVIDPKYFGDLLWLDRLNDASTEALLAQHTGDKAAAGQFWGAVFGGILAGGLTLLAAIVALGGALIQMQREANKEFLEWVVEFSHKFHADKDYCEVRQSLAENRGLFFKWMHRELIDSVSAIDQIVADPCLELATAVNTDNIEAPEKSDDSILLCPVIKINSQEELINWKFVRKATDFFRFYEMVLLVAQRLPEFGNQRETFVGSFAWHIKWLLCSWEGDGMTNQVKNRIIVIYYLAFNHFENLCSVALCFILQYRNALEEETPSETKNLHGATTQEAKNCVDLITSHITSIYKIFEIKNAIKLAPEKHLINYWRKILGQSGAIQ
jgi:hypothetical protein